MYDENRKYFRRQLVAEKVVDLATSFPNRSSLDMVEPKSLPGIYVSDLIKLMRAGRRATEEQMAQFDRALSDPRHAN